MSYNTIQYERAVYEREMLQKQKNEVMRQMMMNAVPPTPQEYLVQERQKAAARQELQTNPVLLLLNS